MRKYKSSWSAVALVVVLLAGFPAWAGFDTAVTATLDTNGTLSPSAGVYINSGNGGSANQYYTPGEVNWTQTGSPKNSLLPTDFTTFCIELTQTVTPGQQYQYTLASLQGAPNPGGGITATKATEIEYLWGTFYNLIGNNGDDAAAFQLAVWKIEYDWGDSSLPGTGSTVSFSSGEFRASSAGNDANPITIATTWLKDLESGNNLTLDANLMALTNSGSQDQIVEVSTNPLANTVPVPSSLYLIGAGVLCLFGYGFMRGKAAVA